jgi:hypothetical protein
MANKSKTKPSNKHPNKSSNKSKTAKPSNKLPKNDISHFFPNNFSRGPKAQFFQGI